jgi:hypothetical protein
MTKMWCRSIKNMPHACLKLENSLLAERLVAFQEGLCTIKLDCRLYIKPFLFIFFSFLSAPNLSVCLSLFLSSVCPFVYICLFSHFTLFRLSELCSVTPVRHHPNSEAAFGHCLVPHFAPWRDTLGALKYLDLLLLFCVRSTRHLTGSC